MCSFYLNPCLNTTELLRLTHIISAPKEILSSSVSRCLPSPQLLHCWKLCTLVFCKQTTQVYRQIPHKARGWGVEDKEQYMPSLQGKVPTLTETTMWKYQIRHSSVRNTQNCCSGCGLQGKNKVGVILLYPRQLGWVPRMQSRPLRSSQVLSKAHCKEFSCRKPPETVGAYLMCTSKHFSCRNAH